MIKYNERILDEINSWEDCDTYVVADFDRTLTTSSSVTSWGLLSANENAPKGFSRIDKELYDLYRPIEVDPNMPFVEKNFYMTQWWISLIRSLSEFGLTQNDIANLMSDSGLINFREGAKELLQSLSSRNIPIIIMSAGLGDTIKTFLERHGVMYPNIHIVSNFLHYEKGVVDGIKGNVIHSLNKNEDLLSIEAQKAIEGRSHIILLGDQISDINMIASEKRTSALKVAFIADGTYNEGFEEIFDVLCTSDTSFVDLSKEFAIFSLDTIKR